MSNSKELNLPSKLSEPLLARKATKRDQYLWEAYDLSQALYYELRDQAVWFRVRGKPSSRDFSVSISESATFYRSGFVEIEIKKEKRQTTHPMLLVWALKHSETGTRRCYQYHVRSDGTFNVADAVTRARQLVKEIPSMLEERKKRLQRYWEQEREKNRTTKLNGHASSEEFKSESPAVQASGNYS